jgi:hypothetical protein
MKSVIVIWFFIVIIFVAAGLGFAYVFQQQQASSAGILAVEKKVGVFDAAIKKLEAQLKTDSENIKTIQNTLTSGDADKKGLSEKVDGLVRQIEEVKVELALAMKAKEAIAIPPVVTLPATGTSDETVAQAVAPSVAPAPAVELGTIPVEKASL